LPGIPPLGIFNEPKKPKSEPHGVVRPQAFPNLLPKRLEAT